MGEVGFDKEGELAGEISNVGKGALGFSVDVVGCRYRDLLCGESRLCVFGCGMLLGKDTDLILFSWSGGCEG